MRWPPGFIDIHSHSDACPLVDYQPESKLCQGVTTEIVGNCGTSILPNTPERLAANQEYFFSELELPVGDLQLTGLYHLEDYQKAVEPTAAPPTTACWWDTALCGRR